MTVAYEPTSPIPGRIAGLFPCRVRPPLAPRRPRLAARQSGGGRACAGPGGADGRRLAHEELLSHALRGPRLRARARADDELQPHRVALSEAGAEARILLG